MFRIYDRNKLEQLPLIGVNSYLSDEGTIYKKMDEYNELDLASIPYIKGLAGPKSILFDKLGIYGYERDHFQKEIPLMNYRCSFENKKKILMDLHKTLKEAHEYLIFENLTSDKIIVTEDGPKIINWDEYYQYDDYYQLDIENDLLIEGDALSDALKLYLISISYLTNFDFEKFAYINGLEKVYFHLIEHTPTYLSDSSLGDYLSDLIMLNCEHLIYFDEYIPYIKRRAIKPFLNQNR